MKTILMTRVLATALALASLNVLAEGEEQSQLTLTPMVRGIYVDGNQNTFAEHEWLQQGVSGGLAEFEYVNDSEESGKLEVSGKSILGEQDYELSLEYTAPDNSWYLKAGGENSRKYFDDTGWYTNRFQRIRQPHGYRIDENLYLDIGRAWFEVGLTPEDGPKIVLGYEYLYKQGTKSHTQYNGVREDVDGGAPVVNVTKYIYPGFKEVNEDVHILSLDVSHTFDNGLFVQDVLTFEVSDTDTWRTDRVPATVGNTNTQDRDVAEGYEHQQLTNALALEKQVNEWLNVSGGYQYSRLHGVVDYWMDTIPYTAQRAKRWFSEDANVENESHLFNVSALATPIEDLALSAGIQFEVSEADADAHLRWDEIVDTDPGPPVVLAPAEPEVTARTHRNLIGLEESLEARYTGISYTTLYAQATWKQENFELGEFVTEDGVEYTDKRTDSDSDEERYRLGMTVSPLKSMVAGLYYQKTYKQNVYSHDRDIQEGGSTGYGAFIDGQEFETDEIGLRLTVQHAAWLRSFYKYQLVATDIHTETNDVAPGGRAFSGNYDANVYTVGATVLPTDDLTLTGSLSYRDQRTSMPDWTNETVIVSNHSDVYVLWLGGRYQLVEEKTALRCWLQFDKADNDQSEITRTGIPYGVNYERVEAGLGLDHQFTEKLSGTLEYTFWDYYDRNMDDLTGYTAHGLMASLKMTF
jgi:hypothetical protein